MEQKTQYVTFKIPLVLPIASTIILARQTAFHSHAVFPQLLFAFDVLGEMLVEILEGQVLGHAGTV